MNEETRKLIGKIEEYIADIHSMSGSDDDALDNAHSISQSAQAAHNCIQELAIQLEKPNEKLERIRTLIRNHATKEQYPRGTINGICEVLGYR